MKFIIIGNGQMVIHCLNIMLANNSTTIELLITDPMEDSVNSVREFAGNTNIRLIEDTNVNSSHILQQINGMEVDYVLNINSRKLFCAEILNLPGKGVINFHNSYLPYYRGINVCSWAIINQDKEYGVTWHLLDPSKIDSGYILAQVKFPIDKNETAFTLILKSIKYGIQLFEEFYPKLVNNTIEPSKITGEGSFYLKKTTPNQGKIDFNTSYEEIDHFVRGLNFGFLPNDFVNCTISANGKNYTVLKIKKEDITQNIPGKIVELDEKKFSVSCKDAAFNIEKLLYEGKSISLIQFKEETGLKAGSLLT